MKFKKVLTVLASIVLWVVILAAALFSVTALATKDTTKVASIFGWTPMTVQSDSMAPTFRAGDLIFIHSCDPDELEVGDVVTFRTIIQNEYALNTHRIMEIQEGDSVVRSFVTKGDNNAYEDSTLICDGDIVGEYRGKLPYFGKIVDFLSKPAGFLLIIVLPLLAFLVYQIYNLICVSQRLKRAEAAEGAGAESIKAETEAAEAARKEAEAALEEARRLKAEAERLKAEAEKTAAAAKTDEAESKE